MLEKQIKAYAPIYDVDEFNQNFDTSLTEDQYNHQIKELGLSNKQETLEVADHYADSYRQMYLSTIKEIADKNHMDLVFQT